MSDEINVSQTEEAGASSGKQTSPDDLDLSLYDSQVAEKPTNIDPTSLSDEEKQQMMSAGIMLDDLSQRSGTFIQMDNAPVHSSVNQDGIEVMSTSEALEKYDWLDEYFWKAVAADTDKYTAHVDNHRSDGYFIRALPGSKTLCPVQACLFLRKNRLVQDVHNIVIAEEGSELHIITGCTAAGGREAGLHLGVSEFYIKKGAKVTFSMIHSWTPETGVRPRTVTLIEEDGLFLSNYVIMKPVYSLQANPAAICNGKNATVRFNSIVVATPGSKMDLGSRVFLNASDSKAEIVSRAITTGGDVIARGYIEGNHPDAKGHMECGGLIMGDSGTIHAIPELKGTLAGVDLSHEAAVGKIAEEEIEYLMARGLSREEATATIVRGFLNVDIKGLPPMLQAEIKKAIESSEQDLF